MQDDLQYRYNAIISEYLARFAEKQGLELDTDDMQADFFWFNEGLYVYSINDIRLDIDEDVPAGKIHEWFSECSAIFEKQKIRINYRSWLMGAR
jgi:hypothetical protein